MCFRFFKPCLSADQSWRLLGWFPVSHPAGCWQLAGISDWSASVWISQHRSTALLTTTPQPAEDMSNIVAERKDGSKKWLYMRGGQYLVLKFDRGAGPGTDWCDCLAFNMRQSMNTQCSLISLHTQCCWSPFFCQCISLQLLDRLLCQCFISPQNSGIKMFLWLCTFLSWTLYVHCNHSANAQWDSQNE